MLDETLPSWAVAPGLPTIHTLRAAVRVAAAIDPDGSRVSDAHESYWKAATGGILPAVDLRRGEELLLDLGFAFRTGDVLHLTPALEAMLGGTFEELSCVLVIRAAERAVVAGRSSPADMAAAAREPLLGGDVDAIATAVQGQFDDAFRRTVGEIGEELVVAAARHELIELGRVDLAHRVRRVSLESDGFGYDVVAPRLSGESRLFEVKATTTSRVDVVIDVYLSRNEVETGTRLPNWVLVATEVDDVEARTGRVIGWLFARELADLLPSDAETGRWESARVSIPQRRLQPGLPRAT